MRRISVSRFDVTEKAVDFEIGGLTMTVVISAWNATGECAEEMRWICRG